MSYSDYFYEDRRKHQQKDKEEKNLILYIPCYDVINKEIYFFDFFTEEIVDLKSIDLSSKELYPFLINQENNFIEYTAKGEINMKKILPKLLSADENEKLEKHLTKFHQNWEKMKILTKFNAISSLGGEYKNYFRRPYYSRFFLSENLKLYSFNSTTNIPQVLKTYTMRIEILFDPCKLEDRDFFTKEEEEKLKNKPYQNDISLTTIVDSLIKEVVDFFYSQLEQDKLNQIQNKDGLKYIHVLKFKEREEYLFGDSLIGAYQFIRGRLRQHETIYFYLKILPLYIVSPPVTSFPPIIRATKANESYINLMKNYLKQYFTNSGIIYRLLRPDEKIKKRFIKQKYKRNEKLSRFTESCDCCFPLWIKIKHLNNIYSLKYWFDDEEYNKNEMLIPNLKFFERKKLMSNLGKAIKGMTFMDKNGGSGYDKKDIKNGHPSNILNQKMMNDKIKNSENEMRKKSLVLMAKKSEKDNVLQKKLNRLSVTVANQNYVNYSYNVLYTNTIFGDDITECINLLSTDELQLPSYAQKVSSTENRRIVLTEPVIKKEIKEEEKNSSIEEIQKSSSMVKNEVEPKKIIKDKEYKLNKLLNQKYKVFILDQYQLPFSPPFLRIKISLLYGSYSILSFRSEPFLFENHINLNDKFIFDNSRCLISNLPFETRIAVTIEAYEKILKNYFNLGSCQIPLYRSDGQIQSGHIKINIWPNISVSPRFNNCSSFGLSTKHKNKIDVLEKGTYPENAEKYKSEILEKMEHDFKNIIKIYNREKKEKDNEKNIDILIRKNEEKEKKKSGDNNNNQIQSINQKHGGGHADKNENNNIKKNEINIEETENNLNDIIQNKEEENDNTSDFNLFSNDKNKDYCSISLEFPSFASPMIYSQNCSQSYRDYLQIKYKKNSTAQMKEEEDDFEEIRKLYGNSQRDIKLIVDNFKESEFTSDDNNLLGGKGNNYFGRHKDNEYDNNYTGFLNSKYNNQNEINEKYPKHIWSYIKRTMPLIVKILKKDPLDELKESEITSILICRDYISTIPSALELFLRAIDWLNPLQVSIAHEYIKKWAKLQVEDAISLLDARFPDTETREFAVRMLRDLPDELINMYMLQLCQCLLYETFLVNPLSDFLIERSLINPKLIGNAFFWNSRVSMKNPLFSDRLTIYLLTILMYSGENFLNNCFNGLYLNDYFEFMTYYVKLKKPEGGESTEHAKVFLDFFNNQLKMTDFTFPIDPTYFGTSFGTNWQVFNSKMLPTKIIFRAREKDDTMPVIFKIGDDLRQDVLTLQIFNIMDKLWLENNLDLKLLPYKVCPTELKAGFIECLVGIELDKLQAQDGVAGVLDRELIVKYLRKTGKQGSPLETKFDNFIKSLAGYCVATCVIGIGDRHPGNIMIKENGIFFHIDFGHILGNFKSKFFIKRERTPFLLTPMMANVYSTEGKEEFFKTSCVKAYNILRHNAQRLINMFIIMSTAGMPELCSMEDVRYAKKMLKLDMPNDEDAGNYFVGLIKQSKNDRFRLIDNIFHYYKHRKPKKKKGKKEDKEKDKEKEKDKDKENGKEPENEKDKKKEPNNNN